MNGNYVLNDFKSERKKGEQNLFWTILKMNRKYKVEQNFPWTILKNNKKGQWTKTYFWTIIISERFRLNKNFFKKWGWTPLVSLKTFKIIFKTLDEQKLILNGNNMNGLKAWVGNNMNGLITWTKSSFERFLKMNKKISCERKLFMNYFLKK